MQKQSNAYVLLFTALTTLILGGLLSITSVSLRPLQLEQVELDAKKRILASVLEPEALEVDKETLIALYNTHFTSIVIDARGEEVLTDKKGNPIVAERINIQKNHKISSDARYLPVFIFRKHAQSPQADAYVLPMFGSGLWDWISGYMALDADMNTVRGMVFDHKTETPGLGARIATKEVQKRFVGKKVFNQANQLVSITMVKGEQGLELGDHHVDGLSGATMTAKGVNAMLKQYLNHYMPYIEKKQTEQPETPSI